MERQPCAGAMLSVPLPQSGHSQLGAAPPFKEKTINFKLTSEAAGSSESGDTGGVFLFS